MKHLDIETSAGLEAQKFKLLLLRTSRNLSPLSDLEELCLLKSPDLSASFHLSSRAGINIRGQDT
jgi:hypothetical protein